MSPLKYQQTDSRNECLSVPEEPCSQKIVGIAGTFDVQNYGDLLFPQIAAAALKRRDPDIEVIPFSVTAKSEFSWPFQVRSMKEFAASVATLSAMLIGGGQIVRFDRRYPVAMPANAGLPFAYWLTPAVLAALAGKPVIWNAVGASTGWSRSAWHDELVRRVFSASYFIGVRDVMSRDGLAQMAPEANIRLLPDTAFSLSRLWPLEDESPAFRQWKASRGVTGNYIVVQASTGVARHKGAIQSLSELTGKNSVVILPVCWCHGDRAEKFPAMKGAVRLERDWPAPRLMAEIIGRSELVFASSLHACITALSYGVPLVRMPSSTGGKYELLDEFEGIACLGKDTQADLLRLVRRGRRIEPRVMQAADLLDRYWDEVAEIVVCPPHAQGELSRALMMAWIATECGDRKRLGVARRSLEILRESLAGYFPRTRSAVRNRLASLRSKSSLGRRGATEKSKREMGLFLNR